MKTEIRGQERLAAEIAARPDAGGKLPAQLRSEAIAYTRRRVAQGVSHAEIARELGVARISVKRWLDVAAPKRRRVAGQHTAQNLRRVRVVEQLAARGAIVVTTGASTGMILGTSRAVRVYAYPEAVDLRKGYDGLFGLVKQGLGRDPLSGELFLFVNSRRKGCKVLVWDGTGLCIFQKRLERGRFAAPWRDDGGEVTMTASELALFIEGCELVGRRALSPAAVVPAPLAR